MPGSRNSQCCAQTDESCAASGGDASVSGSLTQGSVYQSYQLSKSAKILNNDLDFVSQTRRWACSEAFYTGRGAFETDNILDIDVVRHKGAICFVLDETFPFFSENYKID